MSSEMWAEHRESGVRYWFRVWTLEPHFPGFRLSQFFEKVPE